MYNLNKAYSAAAFHFQSSFTVHLPETSEIFYLGIPSTVGIES